MSQLKMEKRANRVAQHAKWPSAKPGSENITKKKKEIKIGKRAKLLERIQE